MFNKDTRRTEKVERVLSNNKGCGSLHEVGKDYLPCNIVDILALCFKGKNFFCRLSTCLKLCNMVVYQALLLLKSIKLSYRTICSSYNSPVLDIGDVSVLPGTSNCIALQSYRPYRKQLEKFNLHPVHEHLRVYCKS